MRKKLPHNLFETLTVPVIGMLIVTWNKLFMCQYSFGLGFDQQSFIYWDFAKSLNLIPFRDFFYPYGLLFYFKIDSVFWNTLSILIIFIILFSTFKIFKNILNDKFFSILFFILFCIFITIFSDIDSFIRYSAIIPVLYLLSESTYKKSFSKTQYGFCAGLFSGILFFLISDIAIYTSALVGFFIIYNFISLKKKLDKDLFKFLISVVSGFLIGIIPFVIFLSINNSWEGYLKNVELLKYVSLFAKIPFPPSFKLVENLFNIFLIVVSLIYLIKRKEKKFIYFIVLSLTLTILLYEYKNIIRTSYESITVIGFLLFLVLFSEIINDLRRKKINSILISSSLLIVVFLFFSIIYSERNLQKQQYVTFWDDEKCVNKKVSSIDDADLKNYMVVKSYLLESNGKIFSYPGDPIFYVLFNQIPPPYPSIYESTPVFAQKEQIDYIKRNNVDYVIINNKSTTIQDGVPDIERNKVLYKYIKNNFEEDRKIAEFIILKKK